MFRIKEIKARQILDSRGNPTVEVDLSLCSGSVGRASIPSGASVGSKEALELRDQDQDVFVGKGVLTAVQNVNTTIRNACYDHEFESQKDFDALLLRLDNTTNKSILGANAILAVSIAFAKAVAAQLRLPLFEVIGQNRYKKQMPMLMLNMINGGVHADNRLSFQEFMIVPQTYNVTDALQIAAEIFYHLRYKLQAMGQSTNVGDEGGFAPNISSTHQALDILSDVIVSNGFNLGNDISLAIDVAANELFSNDVYNLKSENIVLNADELIQYYGKLIEDYNICSIEDPLAENDITGWQKITALLGKKIQIVGDDLFVTNHKILESGIKNKLANALLVKMNQVGTLTETMQAIDLAYANGYSTIVSHRSGETEDTTIAHLAVGIGSKYIKAGSISRTDRVCKYNELLRIAEILPL